MTRLYRKQEDDLKIWIADYMNNQYTQIPFVIQWDHVKLPIGVAVKLKRMRWNNPCFTWPDVFIVTKIDSIMGRISGLFLEVKRSKEEIFKKDGSMRKGEQIMKEDNSLRILRACNYAAHFVWSPETAKNVIDGYLKRES